MRITIINKPDSLGGAAVVSMRLLLALRKRGVDARMLVVDKRSDFPFVELAASPTAAKIPFIAERLGIYMRNGFDRETLFRIDTASDGLNLARHPWVKDADAILLNWVNQGMLSLRDIRKICDLGKPVVWTMHDMWNFTGICHHAGRCREYVASCADCPLLKPRLAFKGLARKTWKRKKKLYSATGIRFVAVSNWLADLARSSSLLGDQDLTVIPNAFDFGKEDVISQRKKADGKFHLLFGAARLDDPIKDFDTLTKALRELCRVNPPLANRTVLTTFGNIRNERLFDAIPVKHNHLGLIAPTAIKELYLANDAVISTSLYETRPGTLVEGQAYGAIPIAFPRGGQSDIITHGETGFLAPWDDIPAVRADFAARMIVEAAARSAAPDADDFRRAMRRSAIAKFSADTVAEQYLRLLAED